MRAFVAVGISPGIKESLSLVQRELSPGMRPVAPKNMHITLKFLGEIDDGVGARVIEAMDSVEFGAFNLRCTGLGAFPSEKLVRVLWAGIDGEGLLGLQAQLEPKLNALGFPKERGRFSPHITVARADGKADVASLLEKHAGVLFGECTADSFSLMKSTLAPGGPAYEEVHSSKARF